jgi:hypothetical protein
MSRLNLDGTGFTQEPDLPSRQLSGEVTMYALAPKGEPKLLGKYTVCLQTEAHWNETDFEVMEKAIEKSTERIRAPIWLRTQSLFWFRLFQR